jgi:WD40 repeat protein
MGNVIRLYHLTTGELLTTLTGHTAPITGVTFSPDGKQVAASSTDGTILIWNVP